MSVTAITGLVSSLFNVTEKLLESKPNYSQEKKEYFSKLKLKFEQEKVSGDRDMELMMNIRDELTLFVDTFIQEIKSAKSN